MIRFAMFLVAVLVANQAPAQNANALRVYFIGNSVTDTINYRALVELAKSRGHQQVWGRHMIPRTPSSGSGNIRMTASRNSPSGITPRPLSTTSGTF